jgi:hypothetical protein
MASQYDPRIPRERTPCSNAPEAQTLRTSQTLQAKAEIPQYAKNTQEPAPRMQALFTGLQARYG